MRLACQCLGQRIAYVLTGRFKAEQIRELAVLLKIDDPVITDNRLHVPDIEALCILLRRLAYPCRLYDLSLIFGRYEENISRIVSFMITHIDLT